MTIEQKDLAEGNDAAGPLEHEVREALGRVTGQAPFAQSHRLSKFLIYVVEETLAGRSDKISGYSVGVDVFDKPEDFDPVTDTNVRVEATRMRRRLVDYYRGSGADDPVEILVPRGGYVPEFHYRLSDRVTSSVVSTETTTPRSRKPSLAVLPFQNYGTNIDDQFFADGLTEETIANFARFKELSVFSRTTSVQLAENGWNIQRIHDELGADFVIEGSVRKSADTVRVTVQLIDAATDVHLLAEKFDRPCTPEGVFEIQDEIALTIAGRIANHQGPIGRYISRAGRLGQSQRWETYSWIIRFYDYYATHIPERHLEVREGLATALEQDQDSSDALAAMAIVLMDEYRLHINERRDFPALEQAFEHALRAVYCDPDSAFAYHALAMAHFHRQDVAEYAVAADRALALNPGHADMNADLGVCYCCLGDWDRGLQLIDRAVDLSPSHAGWYRVLPAVHHALAGEFEDALNEMKSAPIPGLYWYHACLAWFFAELGRDAERAEAISDLSTIFPQFSKYVRHECQIWCLYEELEVRLIEGLRKAGLDIALISKSGEKPTAI